MKALQSTYTKVATASVKIATGAKENVPRQPGIPSVHSVMTADVTLMKTSFPLKLASCRRINLFVVAEESVSVGNAYVTKPSLEECMADTVKKTTFPVHITMETCVLGMGSAKVADASASVAGKEIGASVHQP